jgi:hypothetical protein
MDRTLQSALAGLFILIVIILGTTAIPPTSGSSVNGVSTTPTVIPNLPTVTTRLPATTGLPRTTPISTVTSVPETVHARIDNVDASDLALGRISYAYVTLTNTGTISITKLRIEITAGRDFGFPIGYQSRFMIHELYDVIGPGDTRTLKDAFNLPLYEGIIPLEGLYTVHMKLYANDYYYIGEWQGEVYLKG